MAAVKYTPPSQLLTPSYFAGTFASLDRLRAFLVLSGYGTIERNGKKYSLTKDYMSIPVQASRKFRVVDLAAKIPNCTTAELRSLIAKAATKNTRIHQNIYQELVHCLAQFETGSYVASFVHLYRLIEHTALYLPLVAIVSKGVNNLTFNDYKEVIDNKAKADLSVLKKFSANILSSALGDSTVSYSFAATSKPQQNKIVAIAQFDSSQISNAGPDFFEIKLKDTDRLIVNFRNQFFHYLYHEKNISLQNLEDPDEFLSICMPNFLNYFAILYRELLIAEWELWA